MQHSRPPLTYTINRGQPPCTWLLIWATMQVCFCCCSLVLTRNIKRRGARRFLNIDRLHSCLIDLSCVSGTYRFARKIFINQLDRLGIEKWVCPSLHQIRNFSSRIEEKNTLSTIMVTCIATRMEVKWKVNNDRLFGNRHPTDNLKQCVRQSTKYV